MPDVAQAKSIYELMVLTAWADGKVEASEALLVHEIVASIPAFQQIGSKSALSQAVRARIVEQGLEVAVRASAGSLQDRDSRELAFRCCARVLDADGEVSGEEAEVLATLQEVFSLSGEDVTRLMSQLHA